LTGISPWTITWSDGTSSNVVSGITSQPYLLQVSPVAQTTYVITNINDAGCQQSVNTQAVVGTFGLPSASISSNQTICTGLSAVHTVSLTGVSPWSFTWTDGNAQTTATGITSQSYAFAVTPTQNTTYRVVYVEDAFMTSGPVSDSANVRVDSLPLTPQIFSALNITCSQATLQWNRSSYSNSYRFDLASDSLFANIISGYQQFNTGTDTFISISGRASKVFTSLILPSNAARMSMVIP
jgi:hypothetical protein